ncbi:hypothetical protein K466DRAFT_664186 [Polyporus arcularius HHB13444]|uniref:F-box domain-containing protein n=1 Tax=Polyporus arcularius HHB13444 TaxID=1314778 RepID=A0A5C3PAC2_9APHY|nr:hypothetical protein K466DRAFT_664186 [Polyporus arcularius HHB13444]
MSPCLTRPRLNLDALLEILCLADLSTQSQIMKTCRVLYREGGKQLLRSNEVSIHTEMQLASFLSFMRADGYARFPHIRTLDLRPSEQTFSRTIEWLVEFFAELVVRKARLQGLSFQWIEDMLPLDGRLAASLAHMGTLTNLSIYYLDHPTWAILRTMCSRLTKVKLVFSEVDNDFRAAPRDELDLIHLLEGSQATLESLTLTTSNLTAIVTSTGPVYPLMKDLTLKPESVWMPIASHYIQAFPNLRSFFIDDSNTLVDRPDVGSPQCVATRATNRSYQQKHGSWKSLAYFHGEPRHLYTLALACRIDHLFIDEMRESADATILRALLADARPARLELGININANFTKADWVAALCELRTPQVQVLTIKLSVQGEDEEMGLEQTINAIYGIIASLPLIAFHLDIQRFEWHPDEPCDTYGDLMNLNDVADRLMAASPSMKTTLVTLDYPPSRKDIAVLAGCPDECDRLFGYGLGAS